MPEWAAAISKVTEGFLQFFRVLKRLVSCLENIYVITFPKQMNLKKKKNADFQCII